MHRSEDYNTEEMWTPAHVRCPIAVSGCPHLFVFSANVGPSSDTKPIIFQAISARYYPLSVCGILDGPIRNTTRLDFA
jgi:hypothetical protein